MRRRAQLFCTSILAGITVLVVLGLSQAVYIKPTIADSSPKEDSVRSKLSSEVVMTRLLDLSGRELAVFPGRFRGFIGTEGDQLLIELNDGSFRLFHASGQEISQLQGDLLPLTFSRSVQAFITMAEDRTYIYSSSGQKLAQVDKPILADSYANLIVGGIVNLFSPNEQYVGIPTGISSAFQTTTYLCNTVDSSIVELEGLMGQFSQDNRLIVTIAGGQSYLYTVSGREVAQLEGTALDFLGSEQNLLLSTDSYEFYLVNSMGQPILQLSSDELPILSPNRQRFVTYSRTQINTSFLYSASGQQLTQFSGRVISFTPDGEKILIFTPEEGEAPSEPMGTFHLLNQSGQEITQLEGKFRRSDIQLRQDNPPQFFAFNPVHPIFSPDQQQVLLPLANKTHLFDLQSGRELAQLEGQLREYSPNSRYLLTVTDGVNWLYDQAGKELGRFNGRFYGFSKDSRYFLLYSNELVQLYDVSGDLVAELRGSYGEFSPNGRTIVVSP